MRVFDPGFDDVEPPRVGEEATARRALKIVLNGPAVEFRHALDDETPDAFVWRDRLSAQHAPGDDLQIPHRLAPEALAQSQQLVLIGAGEMLPDRPVHWGESLPSIDRAIREQ